MSFYLNKYIYLSEEKQLVTNQKPFKKESPGR